MLYLRGYRRTLPELPDALVWGHAIKPGVLINKDGALQATLAYRGPDLDSATFPQLVQIAANLNNVLRRLGAGWAAFAEDARVETQAYPEALWPHAVPALIDEERRVEFQKGQHFEDEYYLSLVYQTPTTRQAWLRRLFFANLEDEDDIGFWDVVAYFEEQVDQLAGLLHDIFPAVERLGDTETWTYLHSCVSTRRHRLLVPDPPTYADVHVADQPFTGGMRPTLGADDERQYLRSATIIGFPAESFPCMLAHLSQLPVAYRLVWRLLPYDTAQARKETEKVQSRWLKKRKKWLTLIWEALSGRESTRSDDYAEEQAQDARMAVALASSEEVRFGQSTCTITVMDPDPQRAAEKLTLCERAVHNQGFATIREDIGAVGAWFGSHPGNVYANVRRPVLNSLHWARMFPGLTAAWAGPKWDSPAGRRCIVQAVSAGGTPFRESLYVGDVGDVFLVGPKGAGKSYWLAMHAVQHLRHAGAQVRFLDKDFSAQVITAAVGGKQYLLGDDDSLAFQPFADIDDELERAWAAEWVTGLFANEGVRLDAYQSELLWTALCNMARVPPHQRTMTGFTAFVQNNDLREVLQKYTVGGPHGTLLDADHETSEDGFWWWYELSTLMRKPSVLAPVLTCLFHKIQRGLTGAPTVIVIDEGWLFLDHPVFATQIREWLKTLRKLNASVWFATQSIMDSEGSLIGDVIFQECATKIFLANAAAHSPKVRQWYANWGLNERQIATIASMVPKRQYYFANVLGSRCYELESGPIQVALLSAASAEERPLLLKLIQEYPDTFAVHWLRDMRNLEWAATALEDVLCGDGA
jgi:type IV secretion system protein VirB4